MSDWTRIINRFPAIEEKHELKPDPEGRLSCWCQPLVEIRRDGDVIIGIIVHHRVEGAL